MTPDNRLQLQWARFFPEAEPLIAHDLAGHDRPSLTFNSHTTSMFLRHDIPVQDWPLDQVSPYPVTSPDDPRLPKKMQDQAHRARSRAMNVPAS